MTSMEPTIRGGLEILNCDYGALLKSQYPNAANEIDTNIPDLLIEEISITAIVNSDHG